nr:MAG TPA: Receptor recognition protein, Long tail, Helical sandwich, Tail fiber [Caudoviricetes sp.]
MINVSDAFKQKLQDGEKVWQEVEITFPDGTVKTVKDEIMGENCTFSDCAESSSFPIGCVICKSMTLELDNTSDQWKNYNFYMAKVHAYLKMKIDADTIETIDKGVYTITAPEQYGEILSFAALDDMYKTNAVFSTKLVLPQTVESLVRDACGTLGITAGFSKMTHGNLIVNELPKDMTYRQLFGWAAMLDTANARLDSNGSLQFVGWNLDVTPSIELKDYISMPAVSSDDIVITGINIISGDNSGTYGTSGYILSMENNLVGESDLATVAAQIGDSIIGTKFRNLQGDMAFNPLLEFGDVAYTYDRNLNQYVTPLTDVSCTVNGKTTLKTQADDPIRGMSLYYSGATKAIVAARRLVEKEKNARELAIKKLQESLSVGSGLFATYVQQEDGSTISYFHDKGTLEESKNVIKITSEAIGVSNDGGNTYPFGFQLTGTMITKLLYAEGINANYIDTGALTVRDKGGNILFQVDMDTKTVVINPDVLIVGNMTLSEKLKNMDENIASAKNMTFQLSNDMQTITSDADGNIPVFPTVTTTAKVMYGSNDITNDCSYTVTKSDSVTGSWDVNTHTYTVTGLIADNGWVDIKATYLINLSITKRFTISKQKKGEDGKDGEPGRTYMVEPSCNVLKRGSDKTISPNFITFKAYYRDGKSATRVPYKGRFVVEETADGNTWNTIYTSSTDEDTVTHYLYSILTNGSGQTVASSNGSTVGIPRDVTNVRCKLYASGGTTTLMDMQSVAVVIDVDNLTQSQIVEILSNDGAWKGLYYKNGQLYISFSAALGGELTLGGVNNGNGKLVIRDSAGNQVGYIDNTGVNFTKGTFSGSLNSAKGTFTGELSANTGNIAGWVLDSETGQLKSPNGIIILDAENEEISINGVTLSAYGNGLVADGGFNIICGTEPFSDGTDKFQIFNLDTLSSGNYLRIYNNLVYMSSSSSKRYKILGASLPEEFIENLYNIEPIMARYKEGYLAKGDERADAEFPMFIAEDVDMYFPLAVDHIDGKAENWNERIMIPAMFAMIKAQKKKIDQQEKLINKLCEKLNIE